MLYTRLVAVEINSLLTARWIRLEQKARRQIIDLCVTIRDVKST